MNVSKNSPFKSKIPYLKRANDWFISKYKVAYPWLATKKNPELLKEWCDTLARFRALEEREKGQQHERQQDSPGHPESNT